MNYEKIYNKIIEKRKLKPLDEIEYGEIHHILPRSLGGTDESDNLIRLSTREHFICHALLAEMYEYESFEWYKMNHAFIMMKSSSENHNDRYFNSRLYELKRKDFSKVMSKLKSGENNPNYGKVTSEETKQKIRESLKGKTVSESSKQKMRKARLGSIHSEDTKKKIAETLKNKYKNPENHHSFGTIWIYNEKLKESKRVPKNESVPDGWVLGRYIN